jgi:hypothetical protein
VTYRHPYVFSTVLVIVLRVPDELRIRRTEVYMQVGGGGGDWMYNEMKMKSQVTCFQNTERKNVIITISETAATQQSYSSRASTQYYI